MHIEPFLLERYFAEHEFRARHLLSASDCESVSLSELLALAGPEELDLWHSLWLGYTESQGHPLLRRSIAAQYQNLGPDDILVAAPEEAIFIAMHALLKPGDHVIVTYPAYQSLCEVARAIGCRVTTWPLEVHGTRWFLDPSQLDASITPATRLVIVNFPHNPTGYLPTDAEFAAMVETASRHGSYFFSDEMYRLLEPDPAHRLPAAADLYERSISLSGLSKSYGLPGLRTGWLATADRRALARAGAIKDYTTICSSAPSEILGIIALTARDQLVGRNAEIVRGNLSLARGFFSARPDRFQWLEPDAGPVAFPAIADGVDADAFCESALARCSLMIVPASKFDYPRNHFRLGLGRRAFPAALQVLEEFLQGFAQG